jgi:uncharacterized protein (TIGR03437 family)
MNNRFFLRAILCFVLITRFSVAQQRVLVTYAGTDAVFQGNGTAAASAPLGRLSTVALDPQGHPVFADPSYNLVFRVQNGNIQVIAGNNIQGLSTGNSSGSGPGQSGGGYSGDGGPATLASLNRPYSVAYDAAGNLYISDSGNNRIRKVTPDGTISTFAGDGQGRFQGESQPAVSASLNNPGAIAVDSGGNIYINDRLNLRIRKISNGVISTIAGNGQAGDAGPAVNATSSPLNGPEGLAVDSNGNVYFSEFAGQRVRKVTPAGQMTTIAGNGAVGLASGGPNALGAPSGVAVDLSGNIYICDTANQTILEVSGSAIKTIAGNGQQGLSPDGTPALQAQFRNPYGVAVSTQGDIYIADRDNFRIRHLDTTNNVSTLAGNGKLLNSDDGGPASLAPLYDPTGVSLDSNGRLLIADKDNEMIRAVDTKQIFSTIAGNGAEQNSPDGISPLLASFDSPLAVNTDTSGNLFIADFFNNTIREISGAGSVINTPAVGTGALGNPAQVVVDANNNMYIAEFGGNRVRKVAANGSVVVYSPITAPAGLALDGLGNFYVTEFGAGKVLQIAPNGTATVVAGGGQLTGSALEGQAATSAKLSGPAGIVMDANRNIYFTDALANRVYEVTPDLTIHTVAGNGTAAYAGDGGLATNASLNEPWGLAIDNNTGTLYIADTLNNRVRAAISGSLSFALSQSTLSISSASSGTTTAPVTVMATSSPAGLLYSVSADQPWLSVSPASGAMPASLQITADPTGLNPGTYTGNVTVTVPGASPATRTIATTFTVGAAAPPALEVDTKTLGFAFIAGASPVSQQVTVRNLGSGPLSFTATTTTASCAGWLAVSLANATATPNAPGSVIVTVTPTQLPTGTCTGTLTIASTTPNASVAIPVAVSVSAPSTKLQLSQPGLTYQAIAGGGGPLPRTFGIFNAGQGSMDWTATPSTFSGGPWLSISPAGGTVATPLTDISQVAVSVNPSGLAPGTYYGKVDVNVTGNAVQTVIVALNVLASGASAPPDIYPAALIFQGAPGANPGAQTVSIANLGSQSATYSSSRLTQSGTPWFVHVPTSGTVAPNQPANVVVQPDFSKLSPGIYQGTINFQFSGGTTASVQVLAVVAAGTGTSNGQLRFHADDATNGCTPNSLSISLNGSQQQISFVIGQPVTIDVKVTDNCGPLTSNARSAQVQVAFSNHDPNLNLTPDPTQPGRWTQSWQPKNAPPSGSMTVDILASEQTPSVLGKEIIVPASLQTVSAAATPPIIASGAIQNAASFATGPIAPGSLITIQGSNLASGTALSSTPFQTTLGDTQILLGGTPMPLLYASNGQVNAQVPADVSTLSNVNQAPQIIVQRSGVPSVPQAINLAAASPAIFTQDQSGQGQGTIVDANNQAIADSSMPAAAGDTLVVYCTGLGAVNPPVPAGQPASTTVLSRTVNPVTATIGGLSATVNFAGLAPGFTGLYQVNVVVPQGVQTGNQVPIVLSVSGQQSPPVTIAVK